MSGTFVALLRDEAMAALREALARIAAARVSVMAGTAIGSSVQLLHTLETVSGLGALVLGYAHVAGFREGPRHDAGTIAGYFRIPEDRFVRAMSLIESSDRPEVLLLQNPDHEAKVGAVVLYPSVWSKAYSCVGTPYGRVHRDFHYQVMFSAIAAISEAGCDRIRIDNPMPGHQWRRDAYMCLVEATRSIRAHMGSQISVWLKENEYDPAMPEEVDAGIAKFNLQEHRPVGISPHIFEGMNMRTVFVETCEEALRKSKGSFREITPTERQLWSMGSTVS